VRTTFVFELSREEFLDLLFDDLELPNLVRNQLIGTTEFKTVRAGYHNGWCSEQYRCRALDEMGKRSSPRLGAPYSRASVSLKKRLMRC
jgi:uncharacterized sporulation protein YeaH/YhbH (DUF444 family)